MPTGAECGGEIAQAFGPRPTGYRDPGQNPTPNRADPSDIKTRLIDSQPQAEAPTTLNADRRNVDMKKDSQQSSSGGCC